MRTGDTSVRFGEDDSGRFVAVWLSMSSGWTVYADSQLLDDVSRVIRPRLGYVDAIRLDHARRFLRGEISLAETCKQAERYQRLEHDERPTRPEHVLFGERCPTNRNCQGCGSCGQ